MNTILKAAIYLEFGSQANFSQAINVDETVISRVIHGRRTLRPEDRQKWAKVLGKDVKELFPED